MPDELKPCPFCGSRNTHLHSFGDWVFCEDCGTEGPTTEPVAAWNRRAESQAELTRERDELLPRALFGDQCYQDRCENALIEQTVVDRLSREWDAIRDSNVANIFELTQQRDELAAALERAERGMYTAQEYILRLRQAKYAGESEVRKGAEGLLDGLSEAQTHAYALYEEVRRHASAILAERDAKINREVSEEVKELVLAAKYALMEIVASYRAYKTNNDGSELHAALKPFEVVE